jgi:hypothetical protein
MIVYGLLQDGMNLAKFGDLRSLEEGPMCGQDLTNVTGRSWKRSPAHSALGPYAKSLLHRVRRRRNSRSGPESNKCTPHLAPPP